MNKILSILAIWLCSLATFAQLNTGDDWGLPDNPGLVTKTITVVSANDTYGSAAVTTATTYGTGVYPVGKTVALAATANTGYHFVNWKVGEDVISTSASYNYVMPDSDVTVTATFAPNKYAVKFVSEGTVVQSDSLDFGSAITVPATDPTKEGYTFKNWGTVDSTVPAKDVTYTAVFDINSYDVVFTVEGVEYSKTTQEFGSAITAPASPSKEGYTFGGWTPDATVPAHNVSYDATYTINQYSVTFISDGDTVQTGKQDYASAITAPADPTKEGYTFRGWSPAVDATVPAKDVTYKAVFDINSYDVVFTVEGVEYSKTTQEFGSAITAPASPSKTGYTFGGWTPDATVPAHNVSYDATYTINQYSVTFISDGDTVRSGKQDYASAITAPADPTKTGYTFAGWNPAVAETVPANDVTYTASWTVNSYKLTFDVDGTKTESTVNFGAAITAPADPTKEGYDFTGWTPEVAATMPADDVTYTATWKLAKFKVTFISDGDTISSESMEYTSAITAPADPTKEGYNFLGWNPAVDATVPAKDVTYTASFGKGAFLVTFMVDSVVYSNTSMDFGETIVLPETNPSKTGYTFAGWEGYVEGATVPAQNITYKALWTINKYAVTFISDSDTVKMDSLEYGSAIIAPEDPTKTGYTFDGWSPAVAETVPAADVTYTATWKINSYKLTYMADDKVFFNTTVEYNTAIPMVKTTPTKEGYTFDNWNGIPDDSLMPAEDLTITAMWIANKYTVTFISEGDTVKTDSLDFGTAIVAPENVTKTGYTFDGWTPAVAATVPANDVTYTASFKINQYTVTFVSNEETVKLETLDFGSAIVLPVEPTREGYTFGGWSPEVASTVPADDVKYTALWTINKYAVTFISEGDTVKTDSLDYGTAIVAPENPTKTGYNFDGWTPDVAEKVPAANVTYTALWTVGRYAVAFLVDDDTLKADTLDFGAPIVAPENPTKEGYTFAGWTPDVADVTPAENVTYTATWTVNQYAVTFVVDGDTVKTDTLDYGAAIVAPENPTKEGYEFTGWTPEVAETVPAANVTYEATWSVIVGIKTISLGNAPEAQYYTLKGVKVAKPTKPGLYIVNGVKMIIK